MASTSESVDATRKTNIGRPQRTEVEPKQMQALALLIAGNSRREIAEKLDVRDRTITRWMQEPAVKAEFAQQAAAMSAELWTQFTAETEEVWTIFRSLLRSDDERIQLRAATWYLDRILALFSIERVLEDGPVAMPALPRSLLNHVGEPSDRDQGGSA